MKRFITLILIFTTLITFTQKAVASGSLLGNESVLMVNCSMSMTENDMDMSKCNGNETSHSMNCQNDCDFMSVVSVIHYIEHDHIVTQLASLLTYQTLSTASPYYFSEPLYRPPFVS